jgi:hypothetical protein
LSFITFRAPLHGKCKKSYKCVNLLLAAKTRYFFVGLRNYENKQGEKSNQTIIAGITYENCLSCDLQPATVKKKTFMKRYRKNIIT